MVSPANVMKKKGIMCRLRQSEVKGMWWADAELMSDDFPMFVVESLISRLDRVRLGHPWSFEWYVSHRRRKRKIDRDSWWTPYAFFGSLDAWTPSKSLMKRRLEQVNVARCDEMNRSKCWMRAQDRRIAWYCKNLFFLVLFAIMYRWTD